MNPVDEYEFTLIDFGLMQKLKCKKLKRRYPSYIGNLMYGSYRGIQKKQLLFSDDIESLMNAVYGFMSHANTPWILDF